MEKKGNNLLIILLLLVVVLGLVGFIVYDKILSTNSSSITSSGEKKDNNVSDNEKEESSSINSYLIYEKNQDKASNHGITVERFDRAADNHGNYGYKISYNGNVILNDINGFSLNKLYLIGDVLVTSEYGTDGRCQIYIYDLSGNILKKYSESELNHQGIRGLEVKDSSLYFSTIPEQASICNYYKSTNADMFDTAVIVYKVDYLGNKQVTEPVVVQTYNYLDLC